MMPLTLATQGKYRIVAMRGGMKFKARLNELGIFENDIIEVLTTAPAPVFIKKGDTKVGIGIGMANKIFVEPLN